MRQRVKNGRITNRKRDFIGKHIRNGSHASEIPNGCDVKEDTSLYMRRQMLYATVSQIKLSLHKSTTTACLHRVQFKYLSLCLIIIIIIICVYLFVVIKDILDFPSSLTHHCTSKA